MRSAKHGDLVVMLFLTTALLVCPRHLGAAADVPRHGSDVAAVEKAISITTGSDEQRTQVTAKLGGSIAGYGTWVMDGANRIVVDISHPPPPSRIMSVPAESPVLERVIVANHQGSARLVLDLKGPGIPDFATCVDSGSLVVTLLHPQSSGHGRPESGQEGVLQPAQAKVPQRGAEQTATDQRAGAGCQPVARAPEGTRSDRTDPSGGGSVNLRLRMPDRPREPGTEGPAERDLGLLTMGKEDGQRDTAACRTGIRAYRAMEYEQAVAAFDNLIDTYPSGSHVERATFLLAKSYERLFSDSVAENFLAIKRRYDDAIYGYPTSEYLQEALISVGDLCYGTGNLSEALGYYNLAIQNGRDRRATLRALLPKAKILIARRDMEEALQILEHIADQYPGSPAQTEVEMEMSRIFYEKGDYRGSLGILRELEARASRESSEHPDLCLYLGYNHLQLGNDKTARAYLFRFYNSAPQREESDLVLARIGDTYRDEGRPEEATKIYQLVLELHPEAEGALISLTRLAEQLEAGELVLGRESGKSVRIGGKNVDELEELYMHVVDRLASKDTGNPLVQLAMLSLNAFYQKRAEKGGEGKKDRSSMRLGEMTISGPEDIYRDVIAKLARKDRANPLMQLAALKLGIFLQREEKYDESLDILMDLFREYPHSSHREEILHALGLTLDAIFKENMANERHTKTVNIYHRARDLFPHLGSPDLFLAAARAFARLDLPDMAEEAYAEADLLLRDEEKPPDLLYHLAMDQLEQGNRNNALARLRLLVANHPSASAYVPHAYKVQGEILLAQKEYPKAADMLSSALGHYEGSCERIGIMLSKARASMAMNQKKRASKEARGAVAILKECQYPFPVALTLGNLLLDLGHPNEALSIFVAAHETEEMRGNRIRYKLAMAKGYELLDREEESIAIYNQVSDLNDPFWSKVAEEKVREIGFNQKINEAARGTK